MITDNRHSGMLRTDYETDLARPEEFRAMESGWHRLMYRLIRYSGSLDYREDDGREGTLTPLLADHVLTVVADIMRKQLSGYGESFAEAQGTIGETFFSDKLKTDITGWIDRLEAFIDKSWKTRQNESPVVAVAIQIRDHLKKSLPMEGEVEKYGYYRMLRIVKFIQEHADYYLQQIETSGVVDGALSLLIAYLKNYCGIADAFDHRLAGIPSFYRREILHVQPGTVIQDNTYIVVRPTEKYTLKAGQGFLAGHAARGGDLIYRTTRDETASPMQCIAADAVYLIKNEAGKTTGIRRQAISLGDSAAAESLFDAEQGDALAFGWQMESSMFILNEGEREVSLFFGITGDTADLLPPDGHEITGFAFYLSSADGWTERKNGRCLVNGGRLCFSFTIAQDGTLPTACSEETHRMSTIYPVLRILTNEQDCPYDLASRLKISRVEIRIHVRGIRNFTFYNELGEVDTTQPFQPFGIQAERGAWFLFGNEEMGMKPLSKVRMNGIWQKMPDTEKDFNNRYRDYGVDAFSFKIGTEWQEKREWHTCKGILQPLFNFDGKEKLWRTDVSFNFKELNVLTQSESNHYEYSRDKDGFFRVTLQSPSIGFGTEAYRKRYTETMIHNSRCKEKNWKALPQIPVTPLLADVELEYEAVETLTVVPKSELFAAPDYGKTPFKSRLPEEEAGSLYFAFNHAKGEQTVRMYLDMVLPKKKLPFYNPQLRKGMTLTWEWWNGSTWNPLIGDAIRAEETNGLTQSGFIEIRLPEKIKASHTDGQGRVWLRASTVASSCLALRSVWTNCFRLTAQNGDGQPLSAGTIKEMQEADGRIESVAQPLPGFGGKPAEMEKHLSAHLTARIGNRHRAVNAKDYEQIVLEHFPEVDKAVCLPSRERGKREVHLIVFSRVEDGEYYLSPSWKLTEIQRTMQQYVSPFVQLAVINPVYQEIDVVCKAVLRENVQDENKVVRDLAVLARNYLAPWKGKGKIPDLQQYFSYKELHSRMANHEDLQRMVTLAVGGVSLPKVDFDSEDFTIKGDNLWNILIPKIEIILLSSDYGIGSTEIGSSFIIK